MVNLIYRVKKTLIDMRINVCYDFFWRRKIKSLFSMRYNLLNGKKEVFALILLALFSFFLRVLFINKVNNLKISGDETAFALLAIKYFHVFDAGNFKDFLGNILGIVSLGWGYFNTLYSFLFLFGYNLFHITITDVTVYLPYILAGTLGVVGSYFLAVQFTGKKNALLTSFFISILPAYLSSCRTNLNFLLSLVIFIYFMLFFYRFLKVEKNNLNICLSSLFFSLYFITDNQYAFCFPVIFYMIYLIRNNLSIKDNFVSVFKKPIVWLAPIVFLSPIFISFFWYWLSGHITCGYIGHNIGKNIIIGNYCLKIFNETVSNCGLSMTIILCLAIPAGIYSIYKKEEISILFVWAMSYLIPWCFLISPKVAISFPYILTFQTPLIIFAVIKLYEFLSKKRYKTLQVIIFTIITIEMFFIIITTVYGLTNFPKRHFYGVPSADIGSKAAGLWIRENITPAQPIFTDMEKPVGHYYFHRNCICIYDMQTNPEEFIDLFMTNINKIEIIAISSENIYLIKNYIPKEFRKKVLVCDNGKIVFYILCRDKAEKEIILNLKECNEIFDRKYGNINSLYSKDVWE